MKGTFLQGMVAPLSVIMLSLPSFKLTEELHGLVPQGAMKLQLQLLIAILRPLEINV